MSAAVISGEELRPKRVNPNAPVIENENPVPLSPKRRDQRTALPPASASPTPPAGSHLAPARRKPGPQGATRPSSNGSAPAHHQEVESDPTSLSLLLFTPLIKNDVFDARFSTFGLEIVTSIPILKLTPLTPLFIEVGPAVTFSKLTLSQPAVEFTHLYFMLPLRARAQFIFGSSNWRLDLLAGLQFRPFEYDSRDTADGGFHSTGGIFSSIDPDLAIGLVLPVGEQFRLRAYAGYLKLAVGLEAML